MQKHSPFLFKKCHAELEQAVRYKDGICLVYHVTLIFCSLPGSSVWLSFLPVTAACCFTTMAVEHAGCKWNAVASPHCTCGVVINKAVSHWILLETLRYFFFLRFSVGSEVSSISNSLSRISASQTRLYFHFYQSRASAIMSEVTPQLPLILLWSEFGHDRFSCQRGEGKEGVIHSSSVIPFLI